MKSRIATSLLDRLIEPVSSSLNEEAAQKLIRLKVDARVRARLRVLAKKCNEGELSKSERSEYEAYVMASELVALLQAKARLILAERGMPA